MIGGTSGIGAALVGAYRAQGTPVATWDVAGDPDITCDIADPGAVEAAVRRPIGASACRSGSR